MADKLALIATVDSKVETAKLDGTSMTLVHLGLVLEVNDETGEGEPLRFALHIPQAIWNTLQPRSTMVFRLTETHNPPKLEVVPTSDTPA